MQDFFSKFQDAPSKDLLKMTVNPSHYQKEAVEAAARILAQREVTAEDLVLANEEIEAQQNWLNREADTVNKLKNKTGNFLTYLLTPTNDLDIKRWVYIVCIVTGIQYLTRIYDAVNFTFYMFQCDSCRFGFPESLYIIDVLLPVFIIVLLLKRNKWGWRLLVFSASLVITSKLQMVIVGWRYFSGSLVHIAPTLIVNGGMLWFTYKKAVMEYFGESRTHYAAAIVAAIIFSGAMMLYIPFT